MQKQELSTSLTFVFKYVIPIFILTALVMIIYLTQQMSFATVGILSMYLPVAIGMIVYIYLYRKVKTISIDDQYLYVSGSGENQKIPLQTIERISEMKLLNPRRITIHLKQNTLYGEKIIFLGYHVQFLLFGDHPAITTIQNKLKKIHHHDHNLP